MISPQENDITVVGTHDRGLEAAVPASSSLLERELGQLIFAEFGKLAEVQAEAKVEDSGIRDRVFNNILRTGELQRITWNPDDLFKRAIEEVRSKKQNEHISEEAWEAAESISEALILSVRERIGQRLMQTVRGMGTEMATEK